MARVQKQMLEARRVIEDLEAAKAMAVAEAKQQMHSALEEAEASLQATRDSLAAAIRDKEESEDKAKKLEDKGMSCVLPHRLAQVKDFVTSACLYMVVTKKGKMFAEEQNVERCWYC